MLTVVLALLSLPAAVRGVTESGVLVLYNADNADSAVIAQYYQQVHPDVHLHGLNLGAVGEQVTAQFYLDNIASALVNPSSGVLNTQPWGDQIDVIVTTKGMPLRIDAGQNPGTIPYWRRYSSLESELTRVDVISTIADMGNQDYFAAKFQIPTLPGNPYYLGPETDLHTGQNVPYAGPQAFVRTANEGMRLTARLDGYTRQDVLDSIDRAQRAIRVPFGQVVVVADDPNAPNGNLPTADRMTGGVDLNGNYVRGLDDILNYNGQKKLHDNTAAALTDAADPVMGYVSHGTHDSGTLQQNYIANQLLFERADGAVFHSYESWNACSFNPSYNWSGQGQIGQWFATGGTAALGTVEEPLPSGAGSGADSITNEDIFFDMLLNGYSFAEAAWAATRQLSFVNTVVGDPLMTWKLWTPGDANLDDVVNLYDLQTLGDHWQQTGASWREGDFNNDGIVNQADLQILGDRWSYGAGAADLNLTFDQALSALGLPVPEPATLLLLFGGGAVLLYPRRARPAGRLRPRKNI
ncbi:MAG: TIGR03790 family protein [Phycisphaeraceae bacterium]|nr:TIGR03790 family protein [Phycisphaeraceae bacterium]